MRNDDRSDGKRTAEERENEILHVSELQRSHS